MVTIMIPSQGEIHKVASIGMTYRSQMEEALHHPSQILDNQIASLNILASQNGIIMQIRSTKQHSNLTSMICKSKYNIRPPGHLKCKT